MQQCAVALHYIFICPFLSLISYYDMAPVSSLTKTPNYQLDAHKYASCDNVSAGCLPVLRTDIAVMMESLKQSAPKSPTALFLFRELLKSVPYVFQMLLRSQANRST